MDLAEIFGITNQQRHKNKFLNHAFKNPKKSRPKKQALISARSPSDPPAKILIPVDRSGNISWEKEQIV